MDILPRSYRLAEAEALARQGLPPLLARLLAARGATGPLGRTLGALLPPQRLTHCVAMAQLLADAIDRGERLLIVSDYDADGATACAVGLRGLWAYGANVGFLVPHRLEHGYGLSPEIVAVAAQLQPRPRYIITVDNGISSVAGVEAARAAGIEVLVTDHHLPPAQLPAARLIVNPNQAGCGFPSKALAGVGVMWYVMWALQEEMARRGHEPLEPGYDVTELLALVALGTVADVVPLDANNRILVDAGLQRIRRGTYAGIEALAQAAGRNARELSCADIAFGIGPRINAAGRLATMDTGVRCLTTDRLDEAKALATQLSDINETRRDIEAGTLERARQTALAQLQAGRRGIVAFDPQWHPGVIGIVAGRLRELTYRPTFVLASTGDGIKGSGRSIPGFHLRDALDLVDKRHPGLLLHFGGHAMAAGVTLARGQAEAFAAAFDAVAAELLTPELLRQRIYTDGSLPLSEATLDTATLLRRQVWGQAFPEPLFDDVFELQNESRMGEGGAHRRLLVRRQGRSFNAVQFRAPAAALPAGPVRLLYRLEPNAFRDSVSLQLLVEHALPA